MDNILKKILLFLPFVLATACTNSEFEDNAGGTVPPGMCAISYTVDDMGEGLSRGIAPEGKELLLTDVHILFFKDGSYVDYQHAEVSSGSSRFMFPVPSKIQSNTEYETLVVGNSHSHVPSGYSSFDEYLKIAQTMTYTQMKEQLRAEHNKDHASGDISTFGGLPMWGEMVDGTKKPIPFICTKHNDGSVTFTGSVHFSRCVSRIDLRNYAAKDLIIDKVKICNYRPGGYYFNESAPYGDIVNGRGNAYKWISMPEPSSDADKKTQELTAAMYAYPNIVPVVMQNDAVTTYIMIAGYYQDGIDNTTDNPKKKLSYYRFNVADNGKSQVLRRNHRYLAQISAVKGPGSPSEDDAFNAQAPMLEYSVDNEWRGDDSGTVVDADGNYLTISRTQLTFEGYKDRMETIKVKAVSKDGSNLDWVIKNIKQGTDDENAFIWKKIDETSFMVTTAADNITDFVKTMHLSVEVNGKDKLILPVSLMQLSSKTESRVLLVEGQTGILERTVPGIGGTIELQVQTGSPYSEWIAESDDFTAWTSATYTKKGADRGFLVIDVPANIGTGTRNASIRVKRMLSKQGSGTASSVDTEVGEITINLSQPKSDQLLTVFPMPASSTNGFTIDAFSDTPGEKSANGIAFSKDFWVNLADKENYTWKVESDFHKDYDLALSFDNPLPVNTQAGFVNNDVCLDRIEGKKNGQKFYINVFRTGPGDPLIKGTITVTAVPKSGVQGESSSVSFTVQIRTLCDIDEVKVGDLAVADRNIGALPRLNENSAFVPALNYSNDQSIHITGNSYPDNHNQGFIGTYIQWLDINNYGKNSRGSAAVIDSKYAVDMYAKKNIDPNSMYHKEEDIDKWRLPTKEEFGSKLKPRICYSKQRAFFVSDDKTSGGRFIGCFLQFGGKKEELSDTSTENCAWYWTSSQWIDHSYGCYSHSWVVNPSGKATTDYNYYDGSHSQKAYYAPVRCVRNLN